MEVKKLLLAAVLCSTYSFAQVGVGTTTPRGALDVSSTTSGFIPPQVALTDLTVAAPVLNPQGGALANGTLVWNTNTAGVMPNNVSPGLYYWNGTRWISVAGSPGGLDWSIIGNGGINGGTATTGGTHFLGTYDNTNIDIRTNGVHRARVSNLGEFFIGAYNTVLPGDLMNGVGNATFPWAVNGYTNFNGAGTYGLVQSGTTVFAGVQGEYEGSASDGPGVRGLSNSTGAGTTLNNSNAGVNGQLGTTTDWAFAIKGQTTGNTARAVGGVMGINNNNATYGMLGYERSNGNNNAVQGSVAYVAAAARSSNTSVNSSIGLAIGGGFLGGHLKGNQYGLITKGDIVGQYTDGSSISNKGYAVVNTTKEGNKTVTYAATSTTVDVSTKGTGKLVNGTAKITFDTNYSQLTAKDKPVIVTVTPMGETKGVYIAEVTNNGFIVKENGNGTSNASFYWIAIGEKNNANELNVPSELLTKDFDTNLDSFLTIDEEATETSKAMWWNGTSLEFGKMAPVEAHEGSNIPPLVKRPKETKK
ncbi:MAG TPA: hypothetical protein VK164_12805 [Flavobacterium sp.]|uniref:hypothetical protein n=1 Tax=Flavobacterium sp. TaxID=239 RepID=UPI002B4B2E82|nr:hypothetical protein [Flavobacterium sp.]HLO74809.1 hypothetical protein [Flavobacterium sp.]